MYDKWKIISVQAIKYHKQELTISKEVKDRSSEASTHGNLAVAYQALGAHEMALLHYRAHLNIARELKDTAGEACALLNLGNCLSSRAEFGQAVPYYENYLMLSQVCSCIHWIRKVFLWQNIYVKIFAD